MESWLRGSRIGDSLVGGNVPRTLSRTLEAQADLSADVTICGLS